MIQHKQTEVISTGPPNDTTVVWIDTNEQPPVRKMFIDGEWTPVESGGGGGVSDYSELTSKPQINGVELDGNISSLDLGVYTKPDTGIPASDLANGVIPDVSLFITKSVNDLTNYYLKSETYTKSEVAALIGAIHQFHYEIYNTLPESGESNILYLIGPTGTGSDKYEEYVYANNIFTKIGDTSIDLSGYVTMQALNTALLAYATEEYVDGKIANALDSYTPTSQFAAVATSGDYDDLTNTPTNISEFANDVNYAKYYFCQDEAEYNNIANKDSGTLYLIPES